MGERMKSKRSFACSFFDCKASFSKAWKLEAHLCKHTGLRPFSCRSCERSFRTRYQLSRHQLGHSGEKPHSCPEDGCSEAFATAAGVKHHVARAHQPQEEKPYRCVHPSCGRSFSKKNQLQAHSFQHTQQPSFHCSFAGCDKDFSSHGKLKHHQKVHEGYQCEEQGCAFLARTWTEYQQHRNKEHKVKLPCEQCQRFFNNAWFLHQHQLLVHSGAEKKVLRCPRGGCEESFTRLFNLQSHLLGDHEGKKVFSCAAAGCGKSFAMKESLWRHGVVHDPAKRKLQKLRPKKNQPWHKARQLSPAAAAAMEVETQQLAAKLRSTKLKDGKQ